MPQTLNNVPLPGQSLVATRDLINQNWTTIDTAFQVDHVEYTSANPVQGKHNKVSFPLQSAVPGVVATEAMLYNHLDTFSSLNQLFVRRPNGGSDIPMTAAALTIPGWSYLPSGLILQWGQSTITSNITTPIPLPKTFPTNSLIGQISGAGNPISASVGTITTTTLNVISYGTGGSIFWFVLGY